MRRIFFYFLVTGLLIYTYPSPAAYLMSEDDAFVSAPAADYRLFKEEKKMLSRQRAVEKGLLSVEPSLSPPPPAGPNHIPAREPTPDITPLPVSEETGTGLRSYSGVTEGLFVSMLLLLSLIIAKDVLSVRRKARERRKKREDRRRQIKREADMLWHSYFPREF